MKVVGFVRSLATLSIALLLLACGETIAPGDGFTDRAPVVGQSGGQAQSQGSASTSPTLLLWGDEFEPGSDRTGPSVRGRSINDRATWIVSDTTFVTYSSSGTRTLFQTKNRSGLFQIMERSLTSNTVYDYLNLSSDDFARATIVGIPDTVEVGQEFSPVVLFELEDSVYVVPSSWGLGINSNSGGAPFSYDSSGTRTITALLETKSTTYGVSKNIVVRDAGTGYGATGTIALGKAGLVVGESTTAQAVFVNSGKLVECEDVSWNQSTGGGALAISLMDTTKLVVQLTALAAGSVILSSTCDGTTAAPVTVTIAPQQGSGPGSPPPPPGEKDLGLRFLEIGSVSGDRVLVTSGLPLAPGVMMPDMVANSRLLINGTETAWYVAPLHGLHPDGSLRAIMIQVDIPKSRLSALVRLENSGRTLPLANLKPRSSTTAAVLFYNSTADAVATGVVGPTVDRASIPAISYFSKYETDFDTWQEVQHANDYGAAGNNYYDRVLAYLAMYVRTGNAMYFQRGLDLAERYLTEYMEPASYALPEWQAGLDGIAVAYWLSGDERLRSAVLLAASQLDHSRGGDRMANFSSHPWMDNRVQARVLGTKVLSLQLGATSTPAISYAPGIPNLRTAAAADINWILSTQQSNGAYTFAVQCNVSSNFMSGLLNGVLGQYYSYVTPDARVLDAVRKSYGFLFSQQWVPAEKGFRYYSGDCPGFGSPSVAPDINGLFLDGLGWLYSQTKDETLRANGDLVFQGGVEKAYLNGPKQFNQQYQMSWRWLGYRVGLTATGLP